MSLYEILGERISKGEMLELKDLSEDELIRLFADENINDTEISELFNTSIKQVDKTRVIIENYRNISQNNQSEKNIQAKIALLDPNNFSKNVNALTYYLFSDSPIDNIQTSYNITEKELETMYKFTAKRIAKVFNFIINNNLSTLEQYLDFIDLIYTYDWDKVELS